MDYSIFIIKSNSSVSILEEISFETFYMEKNSTLVLTKNLNITGEGVFTGTVIVSLDDIPKISCNPCTGQFDTVIFESSESKDENYCVEYSTRQISFSPCNPEETQQQQDEVKYALLISMIVVAIITVVLAVIALKCCTKKFFPFREEFDDI